ncbi:MAG: ribosomal protein [Cuniculiplasma sp. C_DKE]|nr:MAG: ribosomal protein [Cuniculiplasma sp. C_DKE]
MGDNVFKELRDALETAKRHISIIESLMREQPSGIIKISQLTGLPDHKIRYSLRVLEKDGIIIPSKDGAIITPDFVEKKEELLDGIRDILKDMNSLEDEINKSLVGRK